MYKNTPHTEDEILHRIALQGVTKLGPVALRALLEHFGSAMEVFRQSPRTLEMIQGVGEVLRDAVEKSETLRRAELELRFVDRSHIKVITMEDDRYPQRLKECRDAPCLLYVKGSGNLNPDKVVSIVGTRKATRLGRKVTGQIIEELSSYGVTVISGLAYGIDAAAHRAALDCELETFAVLAHGMDRIYPKKNNVLAYDMLEQGGLVTELMQGVPPDKDQFPRRNRIVAGLSDATIVVESSKKGGSLITAKIARHYDREVFTVPGRLSDPHSLGCLSLVAQHLALPYVSTDQFAVEMGWKREASVADVLTEHAENNSAKVTHHRPKKNSPPQVEKALQPIVDLLADKGHVHVDDLAAHATLSVSDLSVKLFDLEVRGIVRSLPGKKFALCQ